MKPHKGRAASNRYWLTVTLFVSLLCACQVTSSTSDETSPDGKGDPTQPGLSLLLYSNGSFDPKIDQNGLQPGLKDAAQTSLLDTLADVDLVAAQWSERRLVFGTEVRRRYDASGTASLPICQFVLMYRGVAEFGGDVLSSISARAVDYPVAVYDAMASTEGSEDTLVITLMSRLGYGFNNAMAPFPGLSPETDKAIDHYLADTIRGVYP